MVELLPSTCEAPNSISSTLRRRRRVGEKEKENPVNKGWGGAFPLGIRLIATVFHPLFPHTVNCARQNTRLNINLWQARED